MWQRVLKIIIIILLAVASVAVIGFLFAKPQQNITWGINFSSARAVDLGFEPIQLFHAILEDLKPDKVRIPAYWEELEPTPGQYDFTMIDALLAEAKNYDTEVIVVLGHKQPRWPECHHPSWWNELSKEEQNLSLIKMVEATVSHLKDNQTIIAWQVENEPFFKYGPECETISHTLYKQELNAVRNIDSSRPLIGTDSGEKGIWLTTAWAGIDTFGATMYREVYLDKKGKYLTYPLPPLTYNIKAGLLRILSGANKTIGVELQAEPWFAGSDAQHTPKDEQLKHMNPEIFFNNIDYARRVGFSENYLWGAEWWYWLQTNQNDSSMVDAAKKLFKEQ